jgi:hypothetical protein
MSKVGRNEPCPCNSGKKFKLCCESKPSDRGMSRIVLLMVAVAIVAALLASVFSHGESTAGPGRVWSAEHSHYH